MTRPVRQWIIARPDGPGIRWTTDARAQAVNDLVVVVIEENATAQRDTATNMARQDEQNSNIERFLGMVAEAFSENTLILIVPPPYG